MHVLSIVVLTLTLILASGCEVDDPGCVSDSECRLGRTCQSGVCVGSVTGNSNNGNPTNNQTNNEVNNTNNSANNVNTNNTTSTNNQNNVTPCDVDFCDEGLVCRNNSCQQCESNAECEGFSACSNLEAEVGNSDNRCIEAETCIPIAIGQPCSAAWECEESGFFSLLCDGNQCACFRDANAINFFEADVCPDIVRAESLMNTECGTAIRTQN